MQTAQKYDVSTTGYPAAPGLALAGALHRLSGQPINWERLNKHECRYRLKAQNETIGELYSERSPMGSATTEVRFNNKLFIIRPDLDGFFPSQTTISIETDDQTVGTYTPSWKTFPWKGGQLRLATDAVVEWSQRDLVYKHGIFRSPSGPILVTYEALFQNLFSSLKPWREPGRLTVSDRIASDDLSLILAVGWHLMIQLNVESNHLN